MDPFRPSAELRKDILLQVMKEEHRRARNYVIASLGTASASVAGVILSAQYVARAVSASSFFQYLSLLFSDADIIASFGTEFVLSLVESLPFFAITLVLIAVVALMTSVRIYINNSRHDLTFSFGH